MRRADGSEDGWPEDWRDHVVPVDPDRDYRFPRCWELATGAEVTEFVWYLNRDRDPPRAVLVRGGTLERAETLERVEVRVWRLTGAVGTERYTDAELVEALDGAESQRAAGRSLGVCGVTNYQPRADRSPTVRKALERLRARREGAEREAAEAREARQTARQTERERRRARLADAREARWAREDAAREAREAAAAARVAEVLAALRRAASLTEAAEFLGCDRAAIAYWAERSAEVRAALPGDGRTRQRTEADAAASRRRRKYSDAELVRALESGGGEHETGGGVPELPCPVGSGSRAAGPRSKGGAGPLPSGGGGGAAGGDSGGAAEGWRADRGGGGVPGSDR